VKSWLVLSGDEPLAFLAALQHGGRFKRLAPPPATAYAAVLVRKLKHVDPTRRDSEPVRALRALCDKLRGFEAFSLPLPPTLTDARGFGWGGATLTQRYTYVVPLAERDDFRTSFSHAQRKQCGKAERNGIIIREEDDTEVLSEMLEATSRRAGFDPPLERGALHRIYFEVRKREAGILLVARHPNGTAFAARAIVWGDGVGYDWLAGSDPAYHGTGANSLLVERALLLCRERGLAAFDFCGANTPSVARFKSGFGGSLIGHVLAEYERPIYGLARRLFRSVRGR
jgi:GNAT superfamily N-acetyltransferase